jgi:hypothetical protein
MFLYVFEPAFNVIGYYFYYCLNGFWNLFNPKVRKIVTKSSTPE